MKLNKFAYSKPLRNHTLKILKKIPGNLLKNLEKSWKYHGISSVWKSGNPAFLNCPVPPSAPPPQHTPSLFLRLTWKGHLQLSGLNIQWILPNFNITPSISPCICLTVYLSLYFDLSSSIWPSIYLSLCFHMI